MGFCFSSTRPFVDNACFRDLDHSDLHIAPAELDRFGFGGDEQINLAALDAAPFIANPILARPGARSGDPDSRAHREYSRVRRYSFSCNWTLAL